MDTIINLKEVLIEIIWRIKVQMKRKRKAIFMQIFLLQAYMITERKTLNNIDS